MSNQEVRDSLSEKGLISRGLISDLRGRLRDAGSEEVEVERNKREAKLKDFRLEFDTIVTPQHITWNPTDSTHANIFANIKNPRKEHEWVSDNALLFSEEEAHYINILIHSMFENIGVEVAIVTQNAVPESLTREEAANSLFAHWKVGNFCAQKGLLIYIVKSEKAISLVVGNSLKPIINEERMQKFIEHQQKCLADGTKNFGDAVNTVLLECEALLEETVESPSKKLEEEERMNQSFLVRYRLLIFIILLLLSVLYMGSRNFYKMHCSKCLGNVNFTNLDLELNRGEAIEKKLGSTAHVDKVCKDCKHVDRIRIDNPDFTLCPRCYFATIELAQVPFPQKCEFCGMEVTDVSHIKNNRVPKPSLEATITTS